jgi:RNA polymerase sigma factor (sigma-70 family)
MHVMMTTRTMSVTAPDDAELVVASLSGNRDAFGHIVSRYQSLICSLAYSATGNLGESEDLAQETFITAWKRLGHLREKQKLKAWLCGIARNCINSALRREGRRPIRTAEVLEEAHEPASAEPLPTDQTISKEEEALLWRSLERIPEIYREPLVLFYREHQSIENVSTALDLSEDAVKQRLSRGRKLLADEVTAFVEGALTRTNPGRAFTVAVLASLPILASSAKAATIGAAALKGSTMAKGAAISGLFNAIIGPLIGIVGPWLQYRIFLAAANTELERQSIKRYYRRLLILMLGFAVTLAALVIFGQRVVHTHPLLFTYALVALVTGYVVAAIRMGAWANSMFRKLRQEQEAAQTSPIQPIWEYRSRFELLGLPFIHIRFNRSANQKQSVKAWIAIGDMAFGLLFAFGGVAVAPFSIGGVAIGLMSWGGAATGIFVIGGFALGAWAFGGFALGWQAFGGCAVGWNAAMGGLAMAHDFALGGAAHALQANNDLANQFIKGNGFFQKMEILSHHIGWLNLLWLIPVMGWMRVLRRRQRV